MRGVLIAGPLISSTASSAAVDSLHSRSVASRDRLSAPCGQLQKEPGNHISQPYPMKRRAVCPHLDIACLLPSTIDNAVLLGHTTALGPHRTDVTMISTMIDNRWIGRQASCILDRSKACTWRASLVLNPLVSFIGMADKAARNLQRQADKAERKYQRETAVDIMIFAHSDKASFFPHLWVIRAIACLVRQLSCS